jgi:type II secretory pathway pseudopilin PulG
VKSSPNANPTPDRIRPGTRAAFTLIEVLAALTFMAIVIPVAIEGLRVANTAGVVGQRRAAAARIADRVLNELIVTRQWQRSAQGGRVEENAVVYEWKTAIGTWPESGSLKLLTVRVLFEVQAREYEVRLNTLVDPSS